MCNFRMVKTVNGMLGAFAIIKKMIRILFQKLFILSANQRMLIGTSSEIFKIHFCPPIYAQIRVQNGVIFLKAFDSKYIKYRKTMKP